MDDQDKRISQAEEQTGRADVRTDWALQRTVLANERTFSAWVRTGVAATAAGLSIQKLLGSSSAPWLARKKEQAPYSWEGLLPTASRTLLTCLSSSQTPAPRV